MTPLSYIGVTGIVTAADLYTVRDCCTRMPWTHRFMAGVLVSAKTLRGEYTESRRYPAVDQVEPLLAVCASHGAWPVVYYNTRANGNALTMELAALVRAFPSMRGLQLNVAQPDPSAVAYFAEMHPAVEVIVRINRGAFGASNRGAFGASRVPTDALHYASAYEGARHALLDLSGGNGAAIDASFAARVARAWRYFDMSPRLGVAGGFGPDAEALLTSLREDLGAEAFAALSFAAESRVRVTVEDPTPGGKHQDQLDRDRALAWVSLIAKMVSP